MTAAVALVVAAGCAGGLVGGLAVPWLASVFLGRAYRRARTWWWDSLASYRAFRRAHPQREPSPRAAGVEGSLGLWRMQTVRDAQAGTLPRERLRALVEAGCAIAWQSVPPVPAAALAVAAVAMAAAVACDLRARIVPLETCALLAAAGVAFQASTVGIEGVLAGCAFAAFAVLCCLAVNRLFGRTGRAPVGFGDVRCMAALSLASGMATPVGAALCYGGAAAFSLAGLAAGRLSWRSGIPMAPFLAAWLVGGAFACLHGMG